jgi:hypothetical protein
MYWSGGYQTCKWLGQYICYLLNTIPRKNQSLEDKWSDFILTFILISLFFLKVGWVPSRGCLFTSEYYAFSRWYEFGERRWNDILRGENRRTRRKTCHSATLSTINPTWIDPGANPGLRGERPATNNLSHGTALISLVNSKTARILSIIVRQATTTSSPFSTHHLRYLYLQFHN